VRWHAGKVELWSGSACNVVLFHLQAAFSLDSTWRLSSSRRRELPGTIRRFRLRLPGRAGRARFAFLFLFGHAGELHELRWQTPGVVHRLAQEFGSTGRYGRAAIGRIETKYCLRWRTGVRFPVPSGDDQRYMPVRTLPCPGLGLSRANTIPTTCSRCSGRASGPLGFGSSQLVPQSDSVPSRIGAADGAPSSARILQGVGSPTGKRCGSGRKKESFHG
jgi:hypothetical protein